MVEERPIVSFWGVLFLQVHWVNALKLFGDYVLRSLIVINLLFCLLGCSETSRQSHPEIPDETIADVTPINDIQTIGTHNSYHIAPYPEVIQLFERLGLNLDSDMSPSRFAYIFDYTHKSLGEQLELGIRHVELDVYDDPEGGKFSDFSVYKLLHDNQLLDPGVYHDPESSLDKKGFKVFHLPDSDFRSSCLLFVDCLSQIKSWSDANPRHVPIMVYIEAKEKPFPSEGIFSETIQVQKFNRATWDRLETEILEVLPSDRLITPDTVRGDYDTLFEGIARKGWPTLAEARGKIMFTLDNRGKSLDNYLGDRINLQNRLLFVSAEPGHPAAGWLIRNDPLDPVVASLVSQGYMVRTRADANTNQARNNDYSQRDAAFTSGAHFISTDYPEPDTRFSSYKVIFPEGHYIRVRPGL